MSPDSPSPPRNSTNSTAASVASYCEREWTFPKCSIRQKLSEKKLFKCLLTFSKGENTLFLFACLKISKKFSPHRLRNNFGCSYALANGERKEKGPFRFLLAQESTLNSTPKKRYLTKTGLQSAFPPPLCMGASRQIGRRILHEGRWRRCILSHPWSFQKRGGKRRPPHTIPWPPESPQTIFFLGRQVLPTTTATHFCGGRGGVSRIRNCRGKSVPPSFFPHV